MKPFVWLASYPKSGNTWFRIFLANYRRDGDAPVSINQLDDDDMASARSLFDRAVGYDTTDFTAAEIEQLRPEVYRFLARRAEGLLYMKVHDAFARLADGTALFPADVTHGALYFLRNPLDVCVSFAHHGGHADFERTIAQMADPARSFADSAVHETRQVRQRLLTWSGHVTSWADATEIPRLVVRYEDMKLRPAETFGAAVKFLGLPHDEARVQKAIAFSRFDEARRQEEREGFTEKLPQAKAFFRKGEIGSWREALTAAQAQRIITDHRAVMARFGYLTPGGEPVF